MTHPKVIKKLSGSQKIWVPIQPQLITVDKTNMLSKQHLWYKSSGLRPHAHGPNSSWTVGSRGPPVEEGQQCSEHMQLQSKEPTTGKAQPETWWCDAAGGAVQLVPSCTKKNIPPRVDIQIGVKGLLDPDKDG